MENDLILKLKCRISRPVLKKRPQQGDPLFRRNGHIPNDECSKERNDKQQRKQNQNPSTGDMLQEALLRFAFAFWSPSYTMTDRHFSPALLPAIMAISN
jgi:hypothetical protein